MRERAKVNDGDWFVEFEFDWKYRVRQATRSTAQMVFYNDGDYKNERRVLLDKVVFASLSENVARNVAERLTSSDALCEDERRNAIARRNQRNENITSQFRLLAKNAG